MNTLKYRLTLILEKHDPMHYFSQLDINRILERALRRTDLPVVFTQGFNPHIRISFSHALKLGIEGQITVTLYFTQPITDQEVINKLKTQLPLGLVVAKA